MRSLLARCNLVLASLLLILTIGAFLTNFFYYQYPGNNYFPEHVMALALFLSLLYIGLRLSFPANSNFCNIGQELLYFFGVMALIALATNSVQYTPFPTIDQHIVSLEAAVGIDMQSILEWTEKHSTFKLVLALIYDSLPYQMSILPILVIISCRFHLIREYYFLLLSTTLLGFSFYYFFPTTAPAGIIKSAYFSVSQFATNLKFQQIHHYLNPSTNEGGLIALPSFHVIWAILCIALLREWLIPCVLLALINLLLIASCVLLGWHYITDVFGSVVILIICYYLLKHCKASR